MSHTQDFERKEMELLKKEQELSDAKKVMDILSDYVNYRKSNEAFIQAFKLEHRTLQQSMFRLFLELIEEMQTENYHTDGRNESSKEIAKTLINGFKIAKKEEYLNQGVSEQHAEEYINRIGGQPSKYLPYI